MSNSNSKRLNHVDGDPSCNDAPSRRLRYTGSVEVASTGQIAEALLAAKESVLLVRRGGISRAVVFYCPDGCGDTITINVDSRGGPAWRMRMTAKGVTLMPSVWRTSGCRSHFILWEHEVYWCGHWTDDETDLEAASDAACRLK